MPKKRKGPLEKARDRLSGVWKEADAHGRIWGLKKKDGGSNPFYVLVKGEELVILSSVNGKRYGPVIIHHFRETPDTLLGQGIRALLR